MARFSKQVERDFDRARFKAFVRDLFSQLRRRPSERELLSFESVRRALRAQSSVASGRQTVAVDKIIGSATNRYHDFDRAFLPAQSFTRARWQAVDQAKLDGLQGLDDHPGLGFPAQEPPAWRGSLPWGKYRSGRGSAS